LLVNSQTPVSSVVPFRRTYLTLNEVDAGQSDRPFPLSVSKDPMASRLAHLIPTADVQFADHLSYFHDFPTVERLREIET
jgi:hypothetical protein